MVSSTSFSEPLTRQTQHRNRGKENNPSAAQLKARILANEIFGSSPPKVTRKLSFVAFPPSEDSDGDGDVKESKTRAPALYDVPPRSLKKMRSAVRAARLVPQDTTLDLDKVQIILKNIEINPSLKKDKLNALINDILQKSKEIPIDPGVENILLFVNSMFSEMGKIDVLDDATLEVLKKKMGDLSRDLKLPARYNNLLDLFFDGEHAIFFSLVGTLQKGIDPDFQFPPLCKKCIEELRSNALPQLARLFTEKPTHIVRSILDSADLDQKIQELKPYLLNFIDPTLMGSSEGEIRSCFDLIKERLAYRGVLNLCHSDNEESLSAIIELLKGAREWDSNPDGLFHSLYSEFRNIFLFSPEHLLSPDIYSSHITGLHHLPEPGAAVVEIDKPNATGSLIFNDPKLVTPTGALMTPFTFSGVHIGADKTSAVHAQKISTMWPDSHDKTVQGIGHILANNLIPISIQAGTGIFFGSFGNGDKTRYAYIFVQPPKPNGLRHIGTAFPAALVQRRSFQGPEDALEFTLARTHVEDDGTHSLHAGSPLRAPKSGAPKVTPKKKMGQAMASTVSPLRETRIDKKNREITRKIIQFFESQKTFRLLPSSNPDELIIEVFMRDGMGTDMNEIMNIALKQYCSGDDHQFKSPLKPEEIEEALGPLNGGNLPVIQIWPKKDFYRYVESVLAE